MKTCNGCERLVQNVEISWKGKEYLVDMCQIENTNSILLTGRMVIGHSSRAVETPDWCPKKNENIQKEVSNVH